MMAVSRLSELLMLLWGLLFVLCLVQVRPVAIHHPQQQHLLPSPAASTTLQSLNINQLIEDANATVLPYDYQSLAVELIPYIHGASQNQSRNGYLCSVSLKWSAVPVARLIDNVIHSREFCEWIVIVYSNPSNVTLAEMRSILELKSRRQVEVLLVPPKTNHTFVYFANICQHYMKRVLHPHAHHAHTHSAGRHHDAVLVNNKLLSKDPCSFIHDTSNVGFNPILYSKGSQWLLLLPHIRKFEYVWLLDDDLSFSGIDFVKIRKIHRCTLEQPPAISQMVMHVPSQANSFFYRGSWPDRKILISTIGFVEVQAPLVQAEFLEWYLMSIIVPMYPAMHILGADWGLDVIFCGAAREYLQKTNPSLDLKFHEECALLLGDQQMLHEDGQDIHVTVGKPLKHKLNNPLLDMIQRYYPKFYHTSGKINPLEPNSPFRQVDKFKDNCN